MGASLRNFSQALPVYEAQLASKGVQFTVFLQGFGIEVPANALTEYLNPSAAMKMVASVFSGLGGVLTNTFLILFTVIFILTEASGLPHKIPLALGSPDTLHAFKSFSSSVKSYLAIKTAVSAATGIFIGFWCWMFGVDYPALWGLVAMLLNYVPNIGSIIAAIPAVLLALIQFGVGTSMFVMLGYVLVNVIMGNVVEPKFMGRSLGLSALVVFVSLVFWGWVLGPVGMLLSIPLTMIVKIALESNERTRWIGILLDSDANLKKGEV
jgi:predicted PurR-regulated permease PerM